MVSIFNMESLLIHPYTGKILARPILHFQQGLALLFTNLQIHSSPLLVGIITYWQKAEPVTNPPQSDQLYEIYAIKYENHGFPPAATGRAGNYWPRRFNSGIKHKQQIKIAPATVAIIANIATQMSLPCTSSGFLSLSYCTLKNRMIRTTPATTNLSKSPSPAKQDRQFASDSLKLFSLILCRNNCTCPPLPGDTLSHYCPLISCFQLINVSPIFAINLVFQLRLNFSVSSVRDLHP